MLDNGSRKSVALNLTAVYYLDSLTDCIVIGTDQVEVFEVGSNTLNVGNYHLTSSRTIVVIETKELRVELVGHLLDDFVSLWSSDIKEELAVGDGWSIHISDVDEHGG